MIRVREVSQLEPPASGAGVQNTPEKAMSEHSRLNSIEKRPQADICVVGGAGHVGLPLSIVFASKNRRVLIYDLNLEAMDTIRGGQMPFMELGAESLLQDVLAKG